jgi:hypothetical protein
MITGNHQFMARLARLEAVHGAPQFPRGFVVWDDDPIPADCRPQDLIVRLASKASSPEAWAAQVRRDHPAWFPGLAP